MKQYLKMLMLMMSLVLAFSSCTALKSYERIYVNDPDMQMGMTEGAGFEKYVQSIREGASDATGSKGNGGCGCN